MKLMMSASVCKKNANLSQAPNCNCRTFTNSYETYTSQILCEFQRGVHSSELLDDWGQALAPRCIRRQAPCPPSKSPSCAVRPRKRNAPVPASAPCRRHFFSNLTAVQFRSWFHGGDRQQLADADAHVRPLGIYCTNVPLSPATLQSPETRTNPFPDLASCARANTHTSTKDSVVARIPDRLRFSTNAHAASHDSHTLTTQQTARGVTA